MSIPLLSTGELLAESIIVPGISFGTGALYAAVTNGPVLLTASGNAIFAIASCAIQALLTGLAKNNIISAKTYDLLTHASNLLIGVALLVTAVSLDLIGPVAIAAISIGVIFTVFAL